MKILFIDDTHPLLKSRLEARGIECVTFEGHSRQDLAAVIDAYTGIIIRSRFYIDKELIDKAANLRFIGRVGSGMESIDVAYAAQKGIACLNSPEGNRIAVGEHAAGLLLCLLNKITVADTQIRDGIRNRESNRGVEIFGKTIGIIGYGNTGSAFAQCMSGFGAKILVYDKYKKNFGNDFVKEVSLSEIFEAADVLSLHVSLTEETTYLCDENFINMFQKPFYLINTARGKVVNTQALADGLKKGKIWGAALDVIEYEAVSFEKLSVSALPEAYKYLLSANNVVMTPHVAGWTHESKIKLAEVLLEKIINTLNS